MPGASGTSGLVFAFEDLAGPVQAERGHRFLSSLPTKCTLLLIPCDFLGQEKFFLEDEFRKHHVWPCKSFYIIHHHSTSIIIHHHSSSSTNIEIIPNKIKTNLQYWKTIYNVFIQYHPISSNINRTYPIISYHIISYPIISIHIHTYPDYSIHFHMHHTHTSSNSIKQ